jgi:hypothetical protein
MEKNQGGKMATSLTDPLHYLTPQQAMFVDFIVKGDTAQHAARKAGYSNPQSQGWSILHSPKVQTAVRYSFAKYAQAAQMTRQKVMDGLLEAIELAKIQADANTMVNGWREIGKMCGFYAPEVKKIDISVTTRRVIDRLETLSDADLLRMVEESGEIIEGEAKTVLNAAQTAESAVQKAEFGV